MTYRVITTYVSGYGDVGFCDTIDDLALALACSVDSPGFQKFEVTVVDPE